MNFRFDLGDIQAFLVVADLRHFGRAAEAMHLSQSALSRRIQKIEDVLGVRLLERTTRAVKLTTVGRDFYQKAAHLLNGVDSILYDIDEFSGARTGTVNVACIPSAAHYFLADVLKAFHATSPKIRVNVIDDNVSDVLSSVLLGKADFGITFLGSYEPEIDFCALSKDRFVLACRKDHPLATRRTVRWEEIGSHTYIALSRESSSNRLLIDNALANASKKISATYHAQHLTTLIGMVEGGLGVAAVPSISMPAEPHPVLVSIKLTSPAITRTIGLIRRRGLALSPAAANLYELLRSYSSPA